MARRGSSLLLLALALALAGAVPEVVDKNPALHRLNDRVISTAFKDRNEVVCTYCLFQVVAAAFQLGDELVRREIKDALGSPQPQQLSEALLDAAESHSTLSGTLKGYYQRGVLDDCLRRRSSRCDAMAELVSRRAVSVNFKDPKTASTINEQVERATDGRIKQLFTQLAPDTQLVFASTLVYSDRWPSRLSALDGPFMKPDGTTITVPMLVREEEMQVLDGSRDGVVGVAMTYRDPSIQLYCFTTSGAGDIRNKLYQQHFLDLAAAPATFTQVRIPKFDIVSKKYSYIDLVQLMGMREMFRGGLGPQDVLKVDQLVHKAVIQTDEEGTSAAGAAGIAFVPLSAVPRPFRIVFDSPFICSLVDTTLGQPLFTAYIVDPKNE